jgi:predicted permease
VPAAIGRTITPGDDVRSGGVAGPVAVVSHGFWQRHFGGEPTVIGRTLMVERVPHTIVGVTPPSFLGVEVGRAFDVAVPISSEPLVRGAESGLDRRSYWWLAVMLRRAPDQSVAAATAALRAMQPELRSAAMPEEYLSSLRERFLTAPLVAVPAVNGTSSLRMRYERSLFVMLGVVALVLFVACANIANLLLAKATARRHELAVQRGLGASAWDTVAPLLVEGLLLATAGATLGLWLADAGSLLAQLSTSARQVVMELDLDWRVLAFTSLVTIATTLVFGVAPAVSASRVAPIDAIKRRGRGTSAERRVGMSSALVVAQVALSLVLVVAAALFVRTFASLSAVPLGFSADGVLRPRLVADLTSAVADLPGVAGAAASVVTPVSGSRWNYDVRVAGATGVAAEPHDSLVNLVTPGWLRACLRAVTSIRVTPEVRLPWPSSTKPSCAGSCQDGSRSARSWSFRV